MRGFALILLRCAALTLAVSPVGACRAESPEAVAQTAPALELSGRVVDAANILPPEVEVALTKKLAALETDTKVQFVVVSTPDLEGYDIADYSTRLGNAWGIGDRERNDGLMLVVAPNERKVRVSTGTGMEKKLSDAECQKVIEKMLVKIKASDLPGGIVLGTGLLDEAVREKYGPQI